MSAVSRKPAPSRPARAIAFYAPALSRALFAPRYWGVWLGLALLRVLALAPLALSRSLGALLGLLMLASNAKRRRIARINLELCFPEHMARERERLLRRHFIVYGQSFTDLAHLAWSSRWRLRRMTRLHGIERYRELLKQKRHVILLVPHLVGMNLSGALLASEHPTFCIIKPLRNPVLDWFLHRARVRFGAAALTRDQGLRPAMLALKHGHTFHYSPDEDLGPKHSVFAPFFGVPAATLPTLGRITESADAVVIPCFVRLLSFARGYEVVLHAPLENFPSGDETQDAARMNRAFEAGIRDMPEQYLWTFKLFKTRPANAPSPYDRHD
jgi:Kdo2-lipid IVA lauroyltransferase/acyltransferase